MSRQLKSAGRQAAQRSVQITQGRLPFEDGAVTEIHAPSAPRPKPSPPALRGKNGPLSFAGILAVLLLAGYVAQDTARRTIAEFLVARPSVERLQRAIFWYPTNPLAWRLLGLAELSSGAAPAQGAATLERAVALEPDNADTLLALARVREMEEDMAEAERLLLAAAEAYTGYQPRWELLNFYLRRGDEGSFWKWVKEAAVAYPPAADQIYSQVRLAVGDPASVDRNGVPAVPEIERRYFRLLAEEEDLRAMRVSWPRFSTCMTEGDLPAAATYIDMLIADADALAAVDAWNTLCARGLLPFDRLEVDDGVSLTNGRFASRIYGFGFDWTPQRNLGVTWIVRNVGIGESSLEFRFSGGQDALAVLVDRRLPVLPGRRYRLDFEYVTHDMAAQSGVRWALSQNDKTLAEGDILESAEGYWDDGRFEFDVPEGLELPQLELMYRKISDGDLTRGRIAVRDIRLTLIEPDAAD